VRRGTRIHAAWSLYLEVVEVICTATSSSRMFYGEVTEISNPLAWDWLDDHQFLWVFQDEDRIKVWQESVERPESGNACIGRCYETDYGTTLYAVKWDGYACPTWEAEEN
ncbi:hypothetical protein LZ30DRAFT_558177, partial [Colletotrichum cereale]